MSRARCICCQRQGQNTPGTDVCWRRACVELRRALDINDALHEAAKAAKRKARRK